MALTVGQLQAERDQILAFIATPSRMEIDGTSMVYRPQAELEAALKCIDQEIAKLQSPKSQQFVVQTSRGL